MMTKPKALFHEEQSFRQGWLLLILACALLAGPVGILIEFRSLFGPGPDPAKWAEFWEKFGILVCVEGIILVWFLSIKLTTTVKPDGLFLFYRGLYWKDIPISLEEVESIEAKEYSPLFQYGGWGVRYVRKGKAYNVFGNQGVRINYNNGKHILIGSQEPKKLLKAIQKIQA